MKTLLTIFCLLSIGCAANPQYNVTESTNTVQVTGVDTSTEDSQIDSYKKAIHKALGIEVQSDQVMNFRELTSSVVQVTYQDYKIYLRKFEILDRSQKNGKFYTTIKAVVYSKHLAKLSPEEQEYRKHWNRVSDRLTGEDTNTVNATVRPDTTQDVNYLFNYFLSFRWLRGDSK
jgi:hypothetical protein